MDAGDKELEPAMFKVIVHNGVDSRIDKHRGDTMSVIQKATVDNFGHIVPYVAKVRAQKSDVINVSPEVSLQWKFNIISLLAWSTPSIK